MLSRASSATHAYSSPATWLNSTLPTCIVAASILAGTTAEPVSTDWLRAPVEASLEIPVPLGQWQRAGSKAAEQHHKWQRAGSKAAEQHHKPVVTGSRPRCTRQNMRDADSGLLVSRPAMGHRADRRNAVVGSDRHQRVPPSAAGSSMLTSLKLCTREMTFEALILPKSASLYERHNLNSFVQVHRYRPSE